MAHNFFCSLTLILVICPRLGAQQPDALPAERCTPPPDTELIQSQNEVRFLIVGELHGTWEIPAAFGELVCFVAAAGNHVLVGLEFPESSRRSFQQYLESSGSQADRARFLRDSGWLVNARLNPDGRTSEAMLKMVDRLRELRTAGLDIDVTTFVRPSPASPETQTPYEIGMAASLREAEQSSAYDLVIALIGNLHARNTTFDMRGRESFDPMAMHLPAESTLTLLAITAGGKAWNCQRECGPHRHNGSPGGSTPRIEFGPDLSPGYDGVLAIGPTTASIPVLSESQ